MSDRRFLVLFIRWEIHWTMRWVVRWHPGYAHVLLLSPIGNNQWLLFQWGMDGIFLEPIGQVRASRLMSYATEVIEWDRRKASPASVLHSLQPNTCMTLARQALGLPARLNFFASGWSLRCELLSLGGRAVMPATRRTAT